VNAFAESDGYRMAELVASISLATDLGTGQPVELALRTLDYYCDYSMLADHPSHAYSTLCVAR